MKHDNEGKKGGMSKPKTANFLRWLKDLLKHSQDLCYPKDILVFKVK